MEVIRKDPVKGEVYRHFKGGIATIIDVAEHTETGDKLVIYHCKGCPNKPEGIYARPLEMFMSYVDREKYPDEKQEYRFSLMNSDGNVNHPNHYSGKHECIELIKAFLTHSEFIGFLKGNIFKYRFRSSRKNGEEDIKKSEWYEDVLLEELEEKENEYEEWW